MRLDVAMDDAALVRIGERACDVLEDRHSLAHGERALRCQTRPERFALDVRHDEERQTSRFAGAQHSDDVRMLKAGGQKDLAVESADRDGRCQMLRQHLHRHPTLKCLLERDEHARHAAATELALNSEARAEGSGQLVDEEGMHESVCVVCVTARPHERMHFGTGRQKDRRTGRQKDRTTG